MAAPPTVQFIAPDNVPFAVAAALFAIVTVAYFVQLRRLVVCLKADPMLWQRLGQPSLHTLAGQRAFDRVLHRPSRHGIVEPPLLREIHRTKLLQVAGVLSFVVALVAFFVGQPVAGA